MNWKTKARHLPGRLAAGAFVLNSGLQKRDADDDTANQLHGFACGAYPLLSELDAKRFVRVLSTTEIALGAALLVPLVPTVLAGAGLAGFAGGLVGLYLRTPGMRQEGSVRPTQDGTSLAKDVWLLGMGVGFVVDGLAHKPKVVIRPVPAPHE